MCNSVANLIAFAVCVGLGQALVCLPIIRRSLSRFAPGHVGRVACGLVIAWVTYSAGTKAPSVGSYVAQFVTVLRSGVIIDESGAVARASEEAVVSAFADLAVEINEAAGNTVAAASNDISRVYALITNSTRRVIYISACLPRSGPSVTNHNIAATVEHVEESDGGTNINAWVWFSEAPAFAPGMCATVDVGGGPVLITAVTNDYPETADYNGVPCVRYVFRIPQAARGTVFIPAYEVGFGTPSSPLVVPSGGVSVITNGVETLPYTGWDIYMDGRLRVRYAGGIAVEAQIDGLAVTNGVYQL